MEVEGVTVVAQVGVITPVKRGWRARRRALVVGGERVGGWEGPVLGAGGRGGVSGDDESGRDMLEEDEEVMFERG